MNKVVRDGKVAVLYSPGYGAGWGTWRMPVEAIFHPEIVKLVEEDRRDEITSELIKELFGEDFYSEGSYSLRIRWLPEGTEFHITEHDGNERVVTKEDIDWLKLKAQIKSSN